MSPTAAISSLALATVLLWRCCPRSAVSGHLPGRDGYYAVMTTAQATELIERFYESLKSGDTGAVVELYGTDALVIRFNATSTGPSEISEFYSGVLERHAQYELHSLDQVTESGDVLMWDALVTTSNGVIETTEVLVLDEEGKIQRHIPGFRGYWGK